MDTTTAAGTSSMAPPPDYHSCTGTPAPTTTLAVGWQQMQCSIDLLIATQRESNFLRMIDRKAPILYEADVVANAIRRYEIYWLPMQARNADINHIPPLDVHWIWHTHMLSPVHYRKDCEMICGCVIDHKLLSSEEIQERYETSVAVWNEHCPNEPYDFLASQTHSNEPAYQQKSSYDIAGAVQRQRNFNYQVSLPHFTAPKFLADAVRRYQRFLYLKHAYPQEFCTPCYDFDLVWHTHQVHPHVYQTDCTALLGRLLKHDDTVNDRGANSKLLKGEAITKKLWSANFPDCPFWRRGCMYRGHSAPAFLGFENQDLSNITYGNMHIPSIALKDIPVQREQLRLKLSYGSKKVTTFNADLSSKEVTKSGFSLVWQPTEATASASIVKFQFEKHNPKDLLVELDLFDKMFLQKKDMVKLIGRAPLEQLLPPSNSKLAQNVAHMTLKAKDADADVLKAKVNVTTSLSLNRELQLIVGEFVQQELVPNTRMWDMCAAAALNRCAVVPGQKVHVGTHTLMDGRDGAKYTVQVCHSASLLLSMILVYGRDQRLLAMAHLIGADSLPARDQLDPNLQFLPHLSSSDERAIVIVNKDGDFAIVKGRWTGFLRKIPGDKGMKAKPGNPGKLQVDAFNLLKNTVQKFELPGAEGSTLFVVGDAHSRLPGKRIQCKSTFMAEHIASIFSVATLFVLCNPDKVRERNESTTVGHQCHKWPLTLACGYGKAVPTNRFLATRQRDSGANDGFTGFEMLPIVQACGVCAIGGGASIPTGDVGACGSCGACGACGSCGGCGGGCGGCGGCG